MKKNYHFKIRKIDQTDSVIPPQSSVCTETVDGGVNFLPQLCLYERLIRS